LVLYDCTAVTRVLSCIVSKINCAAPGYNSGNGNFEKDGISSYYLMVKWIATSNLSYADAAEAVIEAWSGELTSFAGHDQMLAAGIYGSHMAHAAELLSYAMPSWPLKARAQAMFQNVIHKVCALFCGRTNNGPPLPKPQTCSNGANGNWDACCMSGVASWAVFLDDKPMLETVLQYYKAGRGNGRLEHYVYASGQSQESGRDQGHVQLGLSKLTETALTLYHALNSTEVFTHAEHRLRTGLEYTAKFNLGGDVPFVPNGGCSNCSHCTKVYPGDWCFKAISNRSGWTQMWEMAAAIYGESAPFTQQVVESQTCQRSTNNAYCDAHAPVCRPPAPPGSNSHSVCINASRYGGGSQRYRPEQLGEGPGLGTLTFFGMPLPPGLDQTPTAGPDSTVAAVLKNDDSNAILPILFMSPEDLVDPWGKQSLVAPDTQNVTQRLCPDCDLSHPGLQQLLAGGLMAPNPLRPEAGMEIFFASASELDAVTATELRDDRQHRPEWCKSIFMMTTLDFKAYSPAVRVASINRLNSSAALPKWLAPHSCMAKSIARSRDGTGYAMLSTCADEGIRPMVAKGPLSLDGFTPQLLEPAFFDHDVFTVEFSATSNDVIDFQITFSNDQNSTPGWNGVGLKFCDNVGLVNCRAGYRRVITMRTSRDGLSWSNRFVCPGVDWSPNQTGQAFDPQFRRCDEGWNPRGMIAPASSASGSSVDEASDDPPELEFYDLTPLFVGNTTRVIAHALLYAPAPLAVLGYSYGMQPPLGPVNKATGKVDLRQAHGPGIGVERWVGPADGNLSAQPMTSAWRRPFRSRVRSSHWIGVGGLIFRDWHIWYNKQTRAMLGLPAYRFAGYKSMANAEFSTHIFELPPRSLWINADMSWIETDLGAWSGSESRAAYLMVAALDADSGKVLPGYEHERCVMMNVSGTQLQLEWNGSAPLHTQHAGQRVRLRMFYRDASIFAVGSMKTDDSGTDDAIVQNAPACPYVRVNPLLGLPQLPKIHYSWSLPASYQVPYWDNVSVADGLLVDYARVTGSLSVQINSGDWEQNSTTVLVQACAAATRMSSPPRTVTIGVNYSPWQHIYKSKSDPRDESKEAAERARLFTNAPRFLGYLAEANRQLGTSVKVGLVMLDSETFTWNESSPTSWVEALTRKHELAYNWTKELFPGVRVMYFGYGQSFWRPSKAPADASACFSLAQPPKRGYCTSTAFSYKERFAADTPFAVSLYEPGEPQLERDQFNTTVSAAWARGVQSVVPYIALGCGWVSPGFVFDSSGTMTHHGSFASFLDYDQRYSAQLGRQVNRPEYASSDFGEWQAAEMAVFYPSPLDVRGKVSAITNGSTHYMDHLLAFVHGATTNVALKTDGRVTTVVRAQRPWLAWKW
jgi:hypothetical protein